MSRVHGPRPGANGLSGALPGGGIDTKGHWAVTSGKYANHVFTTNDLPLANNFAFKFGMAAALH